MSQADVAINRLKSRGIIEEDLDYSFVGDSITAIQERRYLVQKDGHSLSAPTWSEPNKKSPQRFLREDLKDYPDAMILKTKFV